MATTVGVAVIVGAVVEVGITFGDGVGVGVSVGDNLTLVWVSRKARRVSLLSGSIDNE